MRPRPARLNPTLLALALALPGLPLLRAEAPKPKEAKPTRTRWDLALFTELRLVARETGATPNEHPRTVDPALLGLILSKLRVQAEDGEEPLFDPNELGGLVKPFAEALSLATPEQDLLLISSHRRGGGLMGAPLTLCARVFVKDQSLQLILGDTRVDVTSYYLAQRRDPEFHFGSRTQASPARLRTELGTQSRPDWVALPLAPPAAASREAEAPKAAPAPVRDPRERLQQLKRLREENLLSEAEYQAKRAEILKEL